MELSKGQAVRYTDFETGGWFDATVERLVTVGEYRKDPKVKDANQVSQAVLRPVAPAVRDYLGRDGNYTVGVAHWDSCITPLREV
jgi:hypothetical protein